MAIYEYDKTTTNTIQPTVQLKEIPIYGGSRLGQYRTSYTTNAENERIKDKPTALGQRVYEFSNHLQNVLVVLADFKVPVTDGTTTEFKAIVVSANDYYPFGMVMEGRKYRDENYDYRYGFNGQEKSDELDENGNSYTAEYWQYDARLGRRWNVDPVAIEWESSYATFRNNPIVLNDPDGDCPSCNYAIRQGLWNYAIGQIIPEIVINENGHVTGTTWQYAGNYQWVNVTNNKTGYVYTHADLVQRARIVALPTSMGLINPIKTELYSREDNGLFHPITTNGYYRQYVARWGTNSAFWFGSENYMTELWDGGGFGSAIGSSARRVRASMRARSISISPNSGGSLGGGGSFKSITGRRDWMEKDIFGSKFGSDDAVVNNSRRLNYRFEQKGDEGYYTVLAHGSYDRPGYAADLGNGNVTADEVFQKILNDGYVKGTPMTLVICNSGLGTFAQRMANLGNAYVRAPTSKITLNDEGNFIFEGNGKWFGFKPRKDIGDIW